ncbi:putative kinesin [Trypanosoma rangeli]|uniref:Putative kinesin n=1 Tax=Trypanosoma rangeli TaxID=5698 RepID=A0A422MZ05_TRYRA|nr:putative kinesin [Trypanosoma rangeli]RNE98419.1 putative kinesin [Trypanosoma rangeli]|eukprot:RNE98419.1 putative kinesin [Trypanosoma rangeli]
MEGNKRVAVAVRVRPILREGTSYTHMQEKFELEAVQRTGDTSLKVQLQREGEPTRSSSFTFDHIFDQESTQLEVYEESVVDLVEAALSGANVTILAYGQTGSGKTYTVLGDVKPNPLENDLLTYDSGLFLRILSDLTEYKARQAKKGFHVVIGLSCVEIYNESIRDLFGGGPGTPPPPLKAVMIGDEVLLPSLITKEVTSLQAVFNEIQLAISRRKSRSTDSNSTSSRSHCLFLIDILQRAATASAPSLSLLERKNNTKEKEGKRAVCDGSGAGEMPFDGMTYRINGQRELVFGSKIMLADLAGSEKIAKSGVSGEGLAEATSINSSLTALGNVVHSLYEGGYVSYRTSNLTRLLKPTFSQQNSRVLLLSQVSPTQLTFDETISTLHFANKVKAMKVTTTTGAEAERLLFDYLETEKAYDTLLADLHIFETEAEAKSAVIRRKCRQNEGLYYSTLARAKTKTSLKDQRSFIESTGALRFAAEEHNVIVRRRQQEELHQDEELEKMTHEAARERVVEYTNLVAEMRESIAKEKAVSQRLLLQAFQVVSAGEASVIQTKEAATFAALAARFAAEHIVMCRKRIEEIEGEQEGISKKFNAVRLSSIEVPEIADDNFKYAQACWGHTTAKKFFAKCMELREIQAQYAILQKGCFALEEWKVKNKEFIQRVQEQLAQTVE